MKVRGGVNARRVPAFHPLLGGVHREWLSKGTAALHRATAPNRRVSEWNGGGGGRRERNRRGQEAFLMSRKAIFG